MCLGLTSIPTPPHLCSCPGERRSGATDRWSGERRRKCANLSESDAPGDRDFRCVLLPHSWLIERRVGGTTQVSTVGYLPADPPPLSFIDSSSALSPWTSYQYRLVLRNQAGNGTGEISDTTRAKLTILILSIYILIYVFKDDNRHINIITNILLTSPGASDGYLTRLTRIVGGTKVAPCKRAAHSCKVLLTPQHSCRALGQHHHQTFSASRSKPTTGEGPGARVTAGRSLFVHSWFTF